MARLLVCTISGTDADGFIFETVFHIRTIDLTTEQFTVLDPLNQSIITEVIPTYQDTISDQYSLLDVSSKFVLPDTSYTLHAPIALVGTRDGNALPGATCGRIDWLPETGAYKGRQYIPGLIVGDTTNDRISATLEPLLDTLAGAFEFYDGTLDPYKFRLCIFDKSDGTNVAVVGHQIAGPITTLNKRMRA